jgi:outer membrane immunogenic protein
VTMKKRMAIAFFAACLSGGASFAADWPIAAPQLYRPVPAMPIEWTGLYFGVNAGYGWAQGSTNTFFAGDLTGGTTTPLGLGPTELSGTKLNGSGNPSGAIAGGQIGFNWQAGMLVFGAEADGQWLGQQSSFTVVCSSGCVATENVKIKSLATGRARVGLAFDWLLPYVTAGAALVNVSDDLTVTAGGVTGSSRLLAGSTLGWTVGAGLDIALSSTWSARLEYLYVRADDVSTTARIPTALGLGIANEGSSYQDNIVRVGLNYRFGPRGGPGVLERRLTAPASYASAYDFLPSMATFADNAKGEKRRQAAPVVADAAARQPASVTIAKESRTAIASAVATEPESATSAAFAAEPKAVTSDVRKFDEDTDVTDGHRLTGQSNLITLPSIKQTRTGGDDTSRLKRIMAICSGC